MASLDPTDVRPHRAPGLMLMWLLASACSWPRTYTSLEAALVDDEPDHARAAEPVRTVPCQVTRSVFDHYGSDRALDFEDPYAWSIPTPVRAAATLSDYDTQENAPAALTVEQLVREHGAEAEGDRRWHLGQDMLVYEVDESGRTVRVEAYFVGRDADAVHLFKYRYGCENEDGAPSLRNITMNARPTREP